MELLITILVIAIPYGIYIIWSTNKENKRRKEWDEKISEENHLFQAKNITSRMRDKFNSYSEFPLKDKIYGCRLAYTYYNLSIDKETLEATITLKPQYSKWAFNLMDNKEPIQIS